jgi:hypothetical protein
MALDTVELGHPSLEQPGDGNDCGQLDWEVGFL